MTIVNRRGKVVLLHDGVIYVIGRDAYIFVVVKGCTKVDFFEISSHESGTGCQYCADKEAFDGDDICSVSADITRVVNKITTNSTSYNIFLYF